MSASVVRQRISAVELAIKDAGEKAQVNAILDVLKAIAASLEELEESKR